MSQTKAQTEAYRATETLYMSVDLGSRSWQLAFGVALSKPARLRSIDAGDLAGLEREIHRARRHFGLDEQGRVVSCYEAGRDGFWLHRYLLAQGVESQVVDPSSLRVSRRGRRAKTDRLDARELLRHLMRWAAGEERVWSVLRVPTVEQEDRRWLSRELETLKKERNQHYSRMRALLMVHGVRLRGRRDFFARVLAARQWNGQELPAGLMARLQREQQRLELVSEQIRELERERRRRLRDSAAMAKARRLYQLRAIGEAGAWILDAECFGWRDFSNRREVGGCAGLVPTPYRSGSIDHEQGISKAGNRRVRSLMVELAWGWLRYQPNSRLARWYETRFGHGSKSLRKVGIVALARKLLVALWRYVEHGIVPEGALLKATV